VHVTLRRGAGFVRVAMIVIVAASAIALFAGLRP